MIPRLKRCINCAGYKMPNGSDIELVKLARLAVTYFMALL
jgi:hypothetical protein